MKTIQEEIYRVLTADATLDSLLEVSTNNSKIFPKVPKNFESFPCIAYSIVESSTATVPNGARFIIIEFRVFGKTKTLCENIAERIHILLNYRQTWNKNIVYIKHSGELDLPEEDRDLWSKVLRYQVWAKS
jgi:hypothetical protein